jgi:protease YdgD
MKMRNKQMNTKYISKKTIYSFVAGILGLGIIINLASVSAQQQRQSDKGSSIAASKNIKIFQQKVKGESFLPTSLKSDKKPSGQRGVIGLDERRPMESRNYPWSTVGRVQGVSADDKDYHCTGTLVAEDVVLTNAHCVVDPETHKFSKSLSFLPNLIDGKVADKNDIAKAIEVYAGTDFTKNGDTEDWAFVKLNKPIGKKYGYLGWKVLPADVLIKQRKQYFFVGYSGDFPKPGVYEDLTAGPGMTAGIQGQCSITGEKEGVLLHNCDTTGGSSGGPIISWINGQPYIVALNNAEVKRRDNGRAITNLAIQISRIQQALEKR